MPLPLEIGYVDEVSETLLLLPLSVDVGYTEDVTEPLMLLVVDDPEFETYPLLLGLRVGYIALESAEDDPEAPFPLLYVNEDELTRVDAVTPPLSEVEIGTIEDEDSVMAFP